MAKEAKKQKDKRHYFKDFKAELKKVIWPTPKQVVNNTTAVVTIVLLTAIIVFVLDVAFEKMNTYGIDKLKQVVGTEQTNNTANNTDTNSVNNTTGNTAQDNNVAE